MWHVHPLLGNEPINTHSWHVTCVFHEVRPESI
jgi:hypothetical protein